MTVRGTSMGSAAGAADAASHARRTAALRLAVALVLITVTLVTSNSRSAAHRGSALTWTGDVRPLLERRCAGCHSAGRAEPLLDEYESVRTNAHRIRRAVLERRMPPWRARPGFGDFSNDPTLTAAEVDVLVAWLEGGQAEHPASTGSIVPLPPAAVNASPDLTIGPERDTPIASARQVYRISAALPPESHIRGWAFIPGDAAHVRSARLQVGGTVLGIWRPGDHVTHFPAGTGIVPSTPLLVQIEVEYREPAEPRTDRSRVGLYLGSGPVRPVEDVRVRRGTTELAAAMELIELRPSAIRGQSIRVTAERPDGSVEPLLWVSGHDPDRAETYRLRRPLVLPPRSRIHVWSFDADCAVDLVYAAPDAGRR